MHDGIGIVNRHAGLGEERRGRDLPMPSEPVRQRTNGRSLLIRETTVPPEKIQRRISGKPRMVK